VAFSVEDDRVHGCLDKRVWTSGSGEHVSDLSLMRCSTSIDLVHEEPESLKTEPLAADESSDERSRPNG
jgi:hypothetical protein